MLYLIDFDALPKFGCFFPKRDGRENKVRFLFRGSRVDFDYWEAEAINFI
jgi:hypothetical protein